MEILSGVSDCCRAAEVSAGASLPQALPPLPPGAHSAEGGEAVPPASVAAAAASDALALLACHSALSPPAVPPSPKPLALLLLELLVSEAFELLLKGEARTQAA